jgi:hypothetical protein
MNTFTIILTIVLYALTILCFLLPYKSGKKTLGWTVGLILGVVITWTLWVNLDFIEVLIWLTILNFQIIFLIYWAFRLYGRTKIGTILAIVLTGICLLIAMQPWISVWTFSKKDARKILAFHGFELKDDFKITENESGGIRDYYETFTLKISESDYQQIAKKIRTSKNYKGLFTDLNKVPSASYEKKDTIDFETNYTIEREYLSNQKMNNGTFHFRFQLSKDRNELYYVGSDE